MCACFRTRFQLTPARTADSLRGNLARLLVSDRADTARQRRMIFRQGHVLNDDLYMPLLLSFLPGSMEAVRLYSAEE